MSAMTTPWSSASMVMARLMAVSMPSASTSTFIRPSASMSSLSHSMKVRSFIAALPIGHGLVEPALGQHEAAHVLREVAREAQELGGEVHRAADLGIVRIEPSLTDVVVGHAVAPAAPDGVRQRGGDVFGQTERLADVADRAPRPIVDHRGDDGGAMAAISFVHVLHDQLAPLMLEVDVDVGRLVALLGDEALEEHVVVGLAGIDRR